MKITNLKTNKDLFFKNIKIIEPKIYKDERGYFYESWNKKKFNENVSKVEFLQENHSFSIKNVLRGLHFQTNYPQAKLITVTNGKIFDVAVDLRKNSKTFSFLVLRRLILFDFFSKHMQRHLYIF